MADDGFGLDDAAEAEVERLVRRYLAGRKPLFDTRVAQGRVVDGHGDLPAQDIFCLDDGPRVLDCLEFDDRLRYVDGLDDAAFLAMDLEQLGAPGAAAYFLAQYGEYSGDPAPPSLWHHYVAYRAFVRAKVSLTRRLLTTALRHLRTSAICLTLVGGLPGSGKSALSGALSDRLGVPLLSSDRLRKELADIPAEEPAAAAYGEGLYAPEWTRRTYGPARPRGRSAVRRGVRRTGRHLVRCGTARRGAAHGRTHQRRPGGPALPGPGRGVGGRLTTRAPGPSDADPQIAAAMAAEEPPWPEAPHDRHQRPARLRGCPGPGSRTPLGSGGDRGPSLPWRKDNL